MKKYFLIPVVLLCLMLPALPAQAMTKEPDNFRGIPWGAKPPKDINGGKNEWQLLEHRIEHERTVYTRVEDPTFGEAKLISPILYYFHESEGFVGVLIDGIEGYESLMLAHEASIEIFGEPDVDKAEKNDSMFGCATLSSGWFGENISVLTLFRYDSAGRGLLIIGKGKHMKALAVEWFTAQEEEN